VILEVSCLDAATEPFPMVGRSPRSDVLNLVGYVSELLRRVTASSGRSVQSVVQAVVAALPVPLDEAVGA
jgi:hypothetical protein